MDIRTKYILAVLGEMKKYLAQHFISYNVAPKEIADEIQIIAERIKKTTDPLQIRSYLLNYIGSTSSFWRTIAPYTFHNKLLSTLENLVHSDEFSIQSIHIAQMTQLHEHYLVKQKELIEPLQLEIYRLQNTCETLQKTVTGLREENARLRVENDFFLKEIESLHETVTAEKENKIKEINSKTITATVKSAKAPSESNGKTQSPVL
ncbi:MAG: hypothetical protein K2X50_08735 [Gammaproteobacteria bacterium]|nr:hypothetical protein [Gammaproteobacteria bacterium]